MFFDSTDEILGIAKKTGMAVFVLPKDEKIEIKNAIVLEPEEKRVITIEQVKGVIRKLAMKQVSEQFVVIRPADLLNEEAANAFLKTFEEPGEKIHFILITDSPYLLLPTILSRAAVYYLKSKVDFDSISSASEKEKVLAKKIIVAKGSDLVSVAEEIAKAKTGVRDYALKILGLAIEMSYKTYFKNPKEVFLKKINQLLLAYDNISRNGHVKLHIVADLC